MSDFLTTGMVTEQALDVFDFLIDEPHKIPKVYELHGAQYRNFMNWIRMNSRMEANPGQSWKHYEKGWLRTTLHPRFNVADPGVGNSTAFTLSPEDIGANNRLPFEDYGSTVLINNGGVMGECRVQGVDRTNPAQPIVTIEPFSDTFNIGALTAGQNIVVLSNAYAGGSGMPRGKFTMPTARDFSTRLFLSANRIEGHQIGKQTFYESYGTNGVLRGIYYEAMFDMFHELDKDIALAMLIGDAVSNNSLQVSAAEAAYLDNSSNVGNKVLSTKGMIQHITEAGEVKAVPVGTEAFTDFEDTATYLDSQQISSDKIQWFVGRARKMSLDQFLRTSNIATTDYSTILDSMYEGKMKEFAMSFNYSAVEVGGLVHMFTVLDDMNDPKTLNAPGYNIGEWAIGFPIAYVQDYMPDGAKGDIVSNLAIKYYSNNGYDRKNESFELGGANMKSYSTTHDVKGYFVRREMGLDFLYRNQGFIWK